jgi:nucleotide-binding universal stress UspA family protein
MRVKMYNKILHGLDGSDGSFKALAEAIHLAKICKINIDTITVEEMSSMQETIDEVAEEKEFYDKKYSDVIKKAKAMANKKGVRIRNHIVIGHEVKTIVEFIKDNGYDLLVLGFMGHSAIYDRVMGSTCQSLVRIAPCSVLVVK